MSIWASWPAPCDDDDPDWPSPYVYTDSSRYPDHTLERRGWIDVAVIPAHVAYWRDNPNADESLEPDGGWDSNWLRLGVNDGVVILDRAGVELLHRTFTEWLGNAAA